CNEICPILNEVVVLLWDNCEIFKHDWAHLYRNLTGKYRVSSLMGEGLQFRHLKSSKDIVLPDGVYSSIDGLHHVSLLFSNPGVDDVFLPNGNFKSDEFEVLSLITDEVSRKSGSSWSNPPGRLPASHTEGNEKLDQLGNTFTNLPELARGHITREKLENSLRE